MLNRVKSSPKGTFSIGEFRIVHNSMPALDPALVENLAGESTESPRQALQELVSKYEKNEQSIVNACAKSKSTQLQRDCIRNPDEAKSHFAGLKEMQAFLKGHPLRIDRDLEARLEREIKLFGWMVRTQPRSSCPIIRRFCRCWYDSSVALCFRPSFFASDKGFRISRSPHRRSPRRGGRHREYRKRLENPF